MGNDIEVFKSALSPEREKSVKQLLAHRHVDDLATMERPARGR